MSIWFVALCFDCWTLVAKMSLSWCRVLHPRIPCWGGVKSVVDEHHLNLNCEMKKWHMMSAAPYCGVSISKVEVWVTRKDVLCDIHTWHDCSKVWERGKQKNEVKTVCAADFNWPSIIFSLHCLCRSDINDETLSFYLFFLWETPSCNIFDKTLKLSISFLEQATLLLGIKQVCQLPSHRQIICTHLTVFQKYR